MKRRLLGLALLLTACGGGGGTFVKIDFERGTAPAQVDKISLDVMLGAQHLMNLDVTSAGGGAVTLPASKVLEILHGDGALTISARAFVGGASIATGTGGGTVTRGETTEVTISFGDNPLPDAGMPDATIDACVGATCDVDAATNTLTISPASNDFGTVFAGLASPDQIFTVSNGSQIPTDALVVVLSGTNATSFKKSADGCDGQVLAPQASCTLTIDFAPQAAGSATALLRVLDPGTTLRSVTAMLSGTAVTPPALSLSPATQHFADVVAGGDGTDVTFTLTNTGGAPTGALTTASSDATQFVVGADGCSGRTMAAAGTCTIKVHFHPATSGTQNAMLTVSAAPGGMATSALSGNGLASGTLSIGPATHDFGALASGQSPPFTFMVSNTGGAATGSLSAAVLAASTDFAITSDGCVGMTLMPGGSCMIARFSPSSVGSKATTLTVMGSPGGAAMATLTGTSQTAAAISAPAALDFGSVTVGANTTASVTVTNQGDVATTALTTTLPAGEYSFVTNPCAGMPIAARASCTMQLRFSPTAPGARPAGTLQLSAATGGNASVSLSGTGLAVGALSITPSSQDFGSALQGATGMTVSFTVRNTGGSATGTIATALGGTSSSDFRFGTNACAGVTLAANGTCSVDVVFAPASGGAKSATLSATAAPGGAVAANLTATGLAPAALVMTPASFTFPGTVLAQSSATQDFTLRNTGGVATSALAITLGGTNAPEFSIGANTCPATLGAGATCIITVGFTPTTRGARAATLNASAGVMASSTLSGSGLAPAALSFSPTSQAYNSVVVGQTATQAFTISNSGDVATSALATTVTGADAAQFGLSANLCAGQTLQPAGSCTVTAGFTPTLTGAKTAALSVVAGTANGSAALTGTGIAPALLTITPTSNDYLGVLTGATSDQSFIITNTGGAAAGALTLPITGTDATQFAAVAGGTCAIGTTTLAPGAACTVTVRFAPTTRGAKSATVTATASPGGNAAAILAGTGQTPATLSAAMTHDFGNQSVGSSSAPYNWVISNTGDVTSGPISLTGSGPFPYSNPCSTLAAGATCTVPISFTPAAGGAASETVTATASPGGSAAITLMGNGTVAASLAMSPTSKDYLNVLVGSSLDQTFTLSNPGTGATGTIGFSIIGNDFSMFSVVGGSCMNGVTTLAPGGMCTVIVRFAPSSRGAKSATLSTLASPGGTAPAMLAGTGQTPATLSAAVTSHDFGSVALGSSSTSFDWTLSNTGDVATGNIAINAFGGYTVVNGCSAGIAAMSTCTVMVTFTPAAAGPANATVTASTSPGGNASLTVMGSGFVPGPVLTVTKNGTGTVTSTTGGIACGASCNATFTMGSTVTLQARPGNGAGTYFTGWGGACAGLYHDCTVTMDASKTVTASFAPIDHNLAFLSSASYPGTLGGVAMYDAKCNQLATAAGINNATNDAYVSWMAGPGSASSRLGSGRGFMRTDGLPFADDVASLTGSNKIFNPLSFDETGLEAAAGVNFVWTGASSNGAANGTCLNWTSGTGTEGSYTSGPNNWTSANSNVSCSNIDHIYCFMHSLTTPISPPTIGGKRIYISAQNFSSTGGISMANTRCNSSVPPGVTSAIALLPKTGVSAASLLAPGTNYLRVDGTLVGTGSEIAAQIIHSGIWQDAGGSYVNTPVLTGPGLMTYVPGAPADTCMDWTQASGMPGFGQSWSIRNINFWGISSGPCSGRIYCIEQ